MPKPKTEAGRALSRRIWEGYGLDYDRSILAIEAEARAPLEAENAALRTALEAYRKKIVVDAASADHSAIDAKDPGERRYWAGVRDARHGIAYDLQALPADPAYPMDTVAPSPPEEPPTGGVLGAESGHAIAPTDAMTGNALAPNSDPAPLASALAAASSAAGSEARELGIAAGEPSGGPPVD